MFLSIGWGADETIFSWYQIGTGQLDECIGWLQKRFYLVFLESSWLPRVKIFLQWKAMTMFFLWENFQDISVVIVKIIKIRHQKDHSSKKGKKKKIWIILTHHYIEVVHAKGEVIFHLHLQSFEIIRKTRISWLFIFGMQS